MSRRAAEPPGDAPSAVRNSLDSLSLAELRLRRSEKWRDVDPDVLPVWVAEMDFPLAEPVRNTLLEMVARGDTGYPTRTRLPETYAEFAVGRYGFDVDPSRISIVLDVMRGVYLALQLCTLAGDGVVVSPPVYPPFFSTIRFAGRHIVEAPLARDSDSGQWELDLDALERAFALGARTFLLCSPHNPVGRSWSIGELQAVAVLADRYGVVVLADEVHAPLTYPEAQHVPFATLDSPAARRGVTFVSASKAWNLPGLKCAMAIAASKEMSDAFDRLPDEVREEPGILGIAANEAAFRDGRAWLEDVIRYLDVNRRSLREQLEQRLPAVRMVPPQATYLAWLDCRDLGLGEDPAAVFLDRGRVALSPGTKFGTGGRCFARFNFATSRAIVREAVERMSRAIG